MVTVCTAIPRCVSILLYFTCVSAIEINRSVYDTTSCINAKSKYLLFTPYYSYYKSVSYSCSLTLFTKNKDYLLVC